MLSHRLRHRIAFQMQVPGTQDPETGEVPIEWKTVWFNGVTELASVPAEVLTGPGREFIESDAKQSETTARINLRWFPGLDTRWRILWDGNIYNIVSVATDITGRREYRLRCESGVNNGE